MYDWLFGLPAWEDVMTWQQEDYAASGRLVGLMPELKKPSFYASCGFSMEDLFLASLDKAG
jgi:glycerophosphoryl diester phosphodiesterase